MADHLLDVDRLLANPNSRMMITGLSRGTVVGFLQEGFGFRAGNVYGNAFESEAQNKIGDLYNKAAPALGAIAGKAGINLPSQARLQSFEQTTESWTGPHKPSFNIKTTFIATKPTDDVTKPVKALMQTVFPTKGVGSIIQAPMNYGPQLNIGGKKNLALSIQGTVALKIGTWFQAFGLIVENVHPKFSSQVIANGKPLYVEVDIELKPYRAISYGEFLGYFIA